MNYTDHWQNIYATKQPHEVSWTQAVPSTSLQLIHSLQLPKHAAIIDVGAGDSNLVDCLLEEGFTNITVLDISLNAIERAKKRLGEKADTIQWIVSDIVAFKPSTTYDLWHDRAAFHFLKDEIQKATYISLVKEFVKQNLIISSFSTTGPLKCSGIEICQYDATAMTALFNPEFEVKNSLYQDHNTPFNTVQNFLYCTFSRR